MKKEAGFRITLDLQHTITSLEKARIPVISAIQGGCIGGGCGCVRRPSVVDWLWLSGT